MIQQIHHPALSVKDLDRSLRFYRDLLGMRLDWRIDHRKSKELEKIVGLNDVDISYAMLSGWRARIELFQYHSPAGRPYPENKPVCDPGITHMAFEVKGIDAFCQQ
jgi:catechol 2,3-dioxygenase-like lactoylglutathione lyase family enzyme